MLMSGLHLAAVVLCVVVFVIALAVPPGTWAFNLACVGYAAAGVLLGASGMVARRDVRGGVLVRSFFRVCL